MSIERELNAHIRHIRAILKAVRVAGLPSTPVDREDIASSLPVATSAVYFLVRKPGRVVYIGKAANLRGRWTTVYCIGDGPREVYWELSHHRLRQSLDAGDVTIHWLAIDRDLLDIAESVLIRDPQARME